MKDSNPSQEDKKLIRDIADMSKTPSVAKT